MNGKLKCKLCSYHTNRLAKLRKHWQDFHDVQFRVLNAWLAETDEAIAIAEIPAKEGMVGHGH